MNAAASLFRGRSIFAQIFAFAARHRDHVVAAAGEPLRDRKPDAAAAACHQNIMHLIARAFRPP